MTKRALLIGINYYNSDCPLKGCHADTATAGTYLAAHGYTEFNYLLDSPDDPEFAAPDCPTRDNIIAALKSAVAITRPGDTLYIHFSGHGVQVRDKNGDERDGKDECLVPADYDTAPFICDDDIAAILSRAPAGASIRVVFDSCNSGSCADLPWRWNGREMIDEAAESWKGAADIVYIGGCNDGATSADTVMAGRANGALTAALFKSLPAADTWADLAEVLQAEMIAGGYTQRPQLGFTSPQRVNDRVDL